MSVLSWTIYSTVHIFLYSPDHIQYCTYISVLPGPYTVLNIYFCTTRVIHSTVHILLYYLGHIQYWNTFMYFPGHIQYCTYISVLPGPYTVLYICFRTTQTIYSTVHIFLYYPGQIQYCTYIFVLPGPYVVLYKYFCTTRAIYSTVHIFLYYPGYIPYCTCFSILIRLKTGYTVMCLYFWNQRCYTVLYAVLIK